MRSNLYLVRGIREDLPLLRQEGSFPHPHQGEVTLGENNLQLYDYGRDLYDAMLAAIDAAQESIYLESYIWYAVLGERILSPLRILM